MFFRIEAQSACLSAYSVTVNASDTMRLFALEGRRPAFAGTVYDSSVSAFKNITILPMPRSTWFLQVYAASALTAFTLRIRLLGERARCARRALPLTAEANLQISVERRVFLPSQYRTRGRAYTIQASSRMVSVSTIEWKSPSAPSAAFLSELTPRAG
jgi:hypothetical protein